MTPRSIQYVLRTLAETSPTVSDADLLLRFSANDESAFGELVRRHGRLVWAVCRHLTRSDAEADDAFQATFLVLLKNAKKVRDAGKLSAWLHGVAYKVCAKSRLAAQRRSAREQASAVREGVGSAVPDSAWDRALAAVHEEVAKLPETQRVPFVLCCLEGLGVTEAAEQLGWKLGTLSGRLTRAKEAVLLKLEARGLTMGVVASVGLVAVPTTVAAKATALAQVGFAIPGSILQLSQGVIGMSLKPVKLLAAAVILTCGLGLSVGTGWVTSAEAQAPGGGGGRGGPGQTTADPAAEVKRLQAELDRAKDKANAEAKRSDKANQKADPEADVKGLQTELDRARRAAEQDEKAKAEQEVQSFIQKEIDTLALARAASPAAFGTAKWEYDLVDIATTFDKAKFGAFLQEREAKGWEFLGSTTLGKSGGVFQWLFRRPVKVAGATAKFESVPLFFETAEYYSKVTNPPKAENPAAIQAEIDRLTRKLAGLKSQPVRFEFLATALSLKPAEVTALLTKMADKKFGKGKCTFTASDKSIVVEGDKDVVEWALAEVKSLFVN